MKQAILFVLAFAVLSCSDKEVKDKKEAASLTTAQMEVTKVPAVELEKVNAINNSPVKGLKLETFSTYTDDFIGCGCSLYQSEQDKKTGNYIYIDAGDIAMIRLNGEVQKLDYKGESSGATIYANDLIEIRRENTETVESTEMEETSDVKGVLTITKGKHRLEQKFVGYCGC